MIKDVKFDKYKKCVVGQNNHIFKNIKNVKLYDLQTNNETKKLIKKSATERTRKY